MNWAEEVARSIIAKYPNKDIYTIASGISPSGYIHIGNFREIATTYFVGEELKNLGKKVRFIFSFDDFDRFRKVPGGIDPTFEKYIASPYTSMPSPFNSTKTYAKEMEDIFINELKELDITPEFIFQTNEYQSGRYYPYIKMAMSKRLQIFDILAEFKTQKFTEEERNSYYPISIYCDSCHKDLNKVTSYNEETGDISYECTCGHKDNLNLKDAKNIKLQWKIDWPMRWMLEEVIFEPGGRDHSSATGSYNVSTKIAREIFNYEPPMYVAYDFIGVKGGLTKMSSSAGNVLTIADLLKVYDKNIILWFYAKYRPQMAFDIALDNDVIRYYSEYDRFVSAYYNNTLDDKNKSIIALTKVEQEYLDNPNFSYLATFLPMVNYNTDMLKNLLKKEDIDTESIYFKERFNRAKFWVDTYGEEYRVKLIEDNNVSYYETLTQVEKELVNKTIEILKDNYETSNDLQTALYALPKEGLIDEKEIKDGQRKYFQILYRLLLDSDKGPKLGLFLMALPKEDIIKKLTF